MQNILTYYRRTFLDTAHTGAVPLQYIHLYSTHIMVPRHYPGLAPG